MVNENPRSKDRFKDKVSKVLGKVGIQLHADINEKKSTSCFSTRRNKERSSRATMSTFDPLGWITPSIVVMKIFLQELWEKG